jgi:hypothetical protein
MVGAAWSKHDDARIPWANTQLRKGESVRSEGRVESRICEREGRTALCRFKFKKMKMEGRRKTAAFCGGGDV